MDADAYLAESLQSAEVDPAGGHTDGCGHLVDARVLDVRHRNTTPEPLTPAPAGQVEAEELKPADGTTDPENFPETWEEMIAVAEQLREGEDGFLDRENTVLDAKINFLSAIVTEI